MKPESNAIERTSRVAKTTAHVSNRRQNERKSNDTRWYRLFFLPFPLIHTCILSGNSLYNCTKSYKKTNFLFFSWCIISSGKKRGYFFTIICTTTRSTNYSKKNTLFFSWCTVLSLNNEKGYSWNKTLLLNFSRLFSKEFVHVWWKYTVWGKNTVWDFLVKGGPNCLLGNRQQNPSIEWNIPYAYVTDIWYNRYLELKFKISAC